MYEECLKCEKLGKPCDGPNFMAMHTADLVDWCNARRKQLPGMTYDRIVEETGLSKGTVSGFFGGIHADYKLETIRPILKMLVGGEWGDTPCDDPGASDRAAYEDRIRHLEELLQAREAEIQQHREHNAAMQTLITNTNKRNTTDKDFLRSEIKSKRRTIRVLAIALVLCALVIIAGLVVDRLDPSKGYFWLEGLLHLPQSTMEQMVRNM